MGPFKDWKEQLLAGLAAGVLVLIVLINLKLPVWAIFKGTGAVEFLTAESTGSVASDLLVGLFSAYVFYLFVELFPNYRRDRETLRSLNLLVASVADAYETPSVVAHERPIDTVDLTVLSRLKDLKRKIVADAHMYDLKSAMETGHSRYQDVQHALHMATSISPKHAVAWLVLTDRLRLLAQECDTYPLSPFAENPMGQPTEEQRLDAKAMAEHERCQKKMKDVPGTLQQRVGQVIEASIFWMDLQSS
ncbi:hypothetical protein [Pseudomonas syringae]|uniref:hypothetical protein n=1 Tax=Pseudomonas syringae TaxID=317 RepID=UPI0005160B4B|nr:hypothetical protein [Pseudomonas syringae]